MREGENPEFTRRGNGSFSGGFRGRFSGWFQGVGKVCFRQAKQGVREGSARGVREGLTEGQFYERKGGAERRFSPVPDVRYRIWDRGCGGFGHFPRAHLSGTGKGERVRRVKIFFASALPLVIWRRFAALRGIHRMAMIWRRETNASRRQTSNVLVPFLGLVEHLCRVPFVSRRFSLRFAGRFFTVRQTA